LKRPGPEENQWPANHLLALINDVLDLSKDRSPGKMGLHVETFDVAQVIDETGNTLQPAAAKNANLNSRASGGER